MFSKVKQLKIGIKKTLKLVQRLRVVIEIGF